MIVIQSANIRKNHLNGIRLSDFMVLFPWSISSHKGLPDARYARYNSTACSSAYDF